MTKALAPWHSLTAPFVSVSSPSSSSAPIVCDILVVGGGSAGLAAAVSAARLGARTLLVERGGALGGMAPAALVHSICGLYRLGERQGCAGNESGNGMSPLGYANP